MVHFNNKYKSLSEASLHPDGLAAIAILMDFAEEETFKPKLANKFIKYLKNIPKLNDTYTIKNRSEFYTISDLFKSEFKKFYTYQGSLTVPPCNEFVQWFIVQEPTRIFPSEIAELIKIYPKNNRPLQALNGRQIKSC